MKSKKALIAAIAVILVCVSAIAGMSYALFSKYITVENHLQAGNLDVTLKRINLKYCILNGDGELEEHTDTQVKDFTNSTEDNVFGINSTDMRIVPGSYFEAEMQLDNVGNVAFTYNVLVKLNGEATALAQQLDVTVTHPNGNSETKRLSELGGGLVIIGTQTMKPDDNVQSFKVKISFVDDNGVNNLAQTSEASFDIVVACVQAVAQETN